LSIVKQLNTVDDAHVALLDASAAFDTISHQRILDTLSSRKVPKNIIHMIMSLLRNTHFNIKWYNQVSKTVFYPLAGVKQGGILSSFLFAITYDELINNIHKIPCGVLVKNTFLQILVYADDIILISSSSNGLQKLYNEVIKFSNKYKDINMNPDKSCILRLGKLKKDPISFNNIPTQRSARYLGGILSNDISDTLDIERATRSLYAKTHQIINHNINTLSYTSSKVRKVILNAYGTVYALETFEKLSSSLQQAHRYMVMKLWPNFKSQMSDGYITSSKLYKDVADGAVSVKEQHRKLRNNFILKSKKSSNSIVVDIIGQLPTIEVNCITSFLNSILV